VVAAFLAAVSPWRPVGSSDGVAVFRTAASLAFEGTFVLPPAPPGASYDPFYFPASPDGRGVVAVYAPFGSLLGAAVLLAASSAPDPSIAGLLADRLASFGPIAASALAVPSFALLLRLGGARRKPAAALAAGIVLGTFLGPLGLTDFQEPWLVLFAALSLERALASRLLRGARRERALAAAGAAASAALLAKPTAVALLAALLLPVLRPRRGEPALRGALALALSAVPGVALVLALNEARFGSPLSFGYATQLAHPLAQRASALWTTLRLTILPNRGLLWYAPVLLLAPIHAWSLLRGRRAVVAVTALLGFGAFFAANAAWFAWEGGFGWGPRLLAPAVACAVPLLGVRGRAMKLGAALAVAGGLSLVPAYLLDADRLYRFASAADASGPFGPTVPIHRSRSEGAGLDPMQRPHYVPALAPVIVGPRLLASLVLHGDGPGAGGTDAARTHDAAFLRRWLGQPGDPAPESGRLLLAEALATAPVDPGRARRMAERAVEFGVRPVP